MNGYNGIKVQLDNRQSSGNMDYFMRVWLKPDNDFANTTNYREVFLEITNSFRCLLEYPKSQIGCYQIKSDGTYSATTYVSSVKLMAKTWIHFAVGGSSASGTFIRIDYPDQLFSFNTSTYLPMKQNTNNWYAYLGIDSTLEYGFFGGIREFLFTQKYITSSQVANVKNEVMFWDFSQIGNYRLNYGNLQDSLRYSSLTASFIQTSKSTSLPTWSIDTIPIDMCQSFLNYTYLPYFTTSNSFAQNTIDARMQSVSSFAYSGAFWMKTFSGMKTTTSAQTARDGSYFFELDEVFSLWFNDQSTIKMFYHASKNYYETQSSGIYFPLGQWASFQFWFDRLNGYEFKVYNHKRYQIASISGTHYLEAQSPTNKFTLLQNFVGHVKQIMVWNKRQGLPIINSNGNYGTLTDNNLIIYYKFDSYYYQSSGGYYPSYGSANSGSLGQNVYKKGTLSFVKVEWDETATFTAPSPYGLLNQTSTLWDGLSCNEAYYYYRTGSSSSYLATNITTVDTDLYEATVEFWMRKKVADSSPSYYFSLYNLDTGLEYFAILQNNSYQLVCQPISSNYSSSDISYTLFNLYSTDWQHIACRFKSQYLIEGSIYNNNDGLDTYYKQDIVNETAVYIPSGNYQLIIGNTYNKSTGLAFTYFKEVRFWSQSISFFQIKKYRFLQYVYSNEDMLLAYMKLLESPNDPLNFIENTTLTTNNIANEIDTTPGLLCPQYSSPQKNTTCYRNPFKSHNLTLIAIPNGSSIYWQLSSMYSDMQSWYEYYKFDDYSYTFKTNATNMQSNFSNSTAMGAQTITISNSITATLNDKLYFSQQVTNDAYSFFAESNVTIALSKCRYLADTTSGNGYSRQIVYDKKGLNDQNLSFSMKDTCASTSSQASRWLDIKVYPSYLGINNITWKYDARLDRFNITIPRSEQVKMVYNVDTTIIVTAFWVNSGSNITTAPGTNLVHYLNLVYKVVFAEVITPVIIPSYTEVLIGQDLYLNGNQSFSALIQNQEQSINALSYQWTCPSIFSTICTQYHNDQFLMITYTTFLQSRAKYDTSYTFTLTVWKSTDPDATISYNTSQSIIWRQVFKPQFTVTLANAATAVVYSKDNTFSLNLQNYDFTNSQLNITWSFDIAIIKSSSNAVYSRNKTLLTIKQGGLYTTTSYNLNVTVQNTLYPVASTSLVYSFTTGSPPSFGAISVTPSTNGIALYTSYNVTLFNWASSNLPIMYKLWGTSSAISSPFEIMTNYNYQNTSYIGYLPELTALYVEIVDAIYETSYYTYYMNVNSNLFINVVSLVSSAILTQHKTLDIFIMGGNSLNQLNYTANSNLVLTNKYSMLTYLSGLITINNSTSSADVTVSYFLSQSMKFLSIIVNDTTTFDSSISTSVYNIISSLKSVYSSSFTSALYDTTFSSNYLTVISRLITFSLSSTSTSRRILQSSTTSYAQIISEKDNLANLYCSLIDSSNYGVQYTLESSAFTLLIEKVALPYLGVSRSYIYTTDYTQMTIPMASLSQAEMTLSNFTANSTCMQITFYKFNPLYAYTFANQTVVSNITMQANSLNNYGTNILNTNGVSLSQSSFTQTFYYNYNDTTTVFSNNQTVCEYMWGNLTDYTNTTWSYDTVSYTYNVPSYQMGCTNSYLSNSYIAVIKDLTRIAIVDDADSKWYDKLLDLLLSFDNSIIPIFVVLAIVLFVFPLLALWLDSKDYKYITKAFEENREDDEFIKRIAVAKGEELEVIQYQLKLIEKYKRNQKNCCGNCCRRCGLFFKNIHPVLNLFFRFDLGFKRMLRASFIAFQVATISYVCTAAFGLKYREDEFDDADRDSNMDETDQINFIIAGCVLMILTLPGPAMFTRCCRGRVVRVISDEEHEKLESKETLKKGQKSEESKHTDQEKDIDPKDKDSKGYKSADRLKQNDEIKKQRDKKSKQDKSKEEKDEDGNENEEEEEKFEDEIEDAITVVDKCTICKILLIILGIFYVVGAAVFVAIVSGKVPKANSRVIVVSFMIAVIGGWFVLNMLRVIFNLIFAPCVVKNKKQNEGETTGCSDICNFFFVAQDAVDMETDMLLVQDIQENPANYPTGEAEAEDQENKGEENGGQEEVNQSKKNKSKQATGAQGPNQSSEDEMIDPEDIQAQVEPEEGMNGKHDSSHEEVEDENNYDYNQVNLPKFRQVAPSDSEKDSEDRKPTRRTRRNRFQPDSSSKLQQQDRRNKRFDQENNSDLENN